MSTTVDWIWLSLALGIASPAAQIVLTRELDPHELYQMSLQELMQAEYFSPSLCKKLKHNQQALLQKAQRILEHCREKGYRVITVRDSVYPLQLLSLQEPPLVLYALGIPCAICNIAGNQIGVRLAIRAGARAVRALLYVTLTLLLATLTYRFFP